MRRYIFPVILAIAALLIIFGGAIVALYTDWLWFSDLGYGRIFSTILMTRIGVGLVLGFLFFAIIYSNLWYARRIAPPPSPSGIQQQLLERLGRLARRSLGLLLFLGSIVLAAIVGLEAATHWQEWLMYSHATPFGVRDPVFAKDVGFYVFQLPFLRYIYGWLFFALVASTIAAIALHYADEAIDYFGNRLQFAPLVKAHVFTLVALMFFLKAWGYRLSMYGLLSSPGRQFDGAGYTDIHARIPALWILIVVAIIGGLLVLVNITRRGIGLAAMALGGLAVVSILVGSVYPGMIQEFSVKPNELEKELPYIKRAIAFTQRAYGLTQVAPRAFAAESRLSAEQINANSATIENIRLWDQDHLLDAYAQIQTIQQYYHFKDVDVDRYWLTDPQSGQRSYRQVWLSARELDQASLPERSRTWINQRLQYTHGYGFCMSPVNEISTEGLPEFFVYDIPPKTTVDLPIDRMGVYFGELTNEYVFVKSDAEEFDYPTGSENKMTTYEGHSGVGIGAFLRKLLFFIRFGDINIMLNENLKGQSRVLFEREIRSRVQKLLPFLAFDSDPYLVTSKGRLYWMHDAYTTADAYPYSQRYPESRFNYIRNSVKLVTDAYTGDVTAYVIEKPLPDPIISTYRRIFPGVFRDISTMPADLRDHVRYPEDLFRVQTAIYQRYHMSDPQVFYNNSDLWDLARRAELINPADEVQTIEPYYIIMRLPNGEREEFILMTPYIRAGKNNMVAWMCAKCDGAGYGTLVLYQFPRDKNVFGPQQIVARARQDTVISQQLTLWSQEGSEVSSGNLLVIPIESSLLYVMPLYLESTSTKIPELKRVIVALGDRVAMEPTLHEALSAVVGRQVSPTPPTGATVGAPTAPSAPTAPTTPAVPGAALNQQATRLINQAASEYNSAKQAQRQGDWAAYGRHMDALERTLNELKALAR